MRVKRLLGVALCVVGFFGCESAARVEPRPEEEPYVAAILRDSGTRLMSSWRDINGILYLETRQGMVEVTYRIVPRNKSGMELQRVRRDQTFMVETLPPNASRPGRP